MLRVVGGTCSTGRPGDGPASCRTPRPAGPESGRSGRTYTADIRD